MVAPYADEMILISSTDNLHILGFGSGDPKPEYTYQGTQTKTYQGRAFVIAQKIDVSCSAAITVTSQTGSTELSL